MIGVQEIKEVLPLLPRDQVNPRNEAGARTCLYYQKTPTGTKRCIGGEIIFRFFGMEVADQLAEGISIANQRILESLISPSGLQFLHILQVEADKHNHGESTPWGEAIDRANEWWENAT